MKTKVHRNLHKACWSIRESGAKTTHTSFIALANVEFRVSQAGRAKVIANQVRSVHAYAIGDRLHTSCTVYGEGERIGVRYNPYRAGAFLSLDGREVTKAQYAYFFTDGSCEVIL